MFRLKSSDLHHASGSAGGFSRVHCICTARSTTSKTTGSLSKPRIWDRELDRPGLNADPSDHADVDLLAIVARLGLAFFLTAGFVAGLSLNGGTILGDFISERACVFFFFWALALSACVTGRKPEVADRALADFEYRSGPSLRPFPLLPAGQ